MAMHQLPAGIRQAWKKFHLFDTGCREAIHPKHERCRTDEGGRDNNYVVVNWIYGAEDKSHDRATY